MDHNAKCPLSMDSEHPFTQVQCKLDECAWWVEESQSCAVPVLARAVKKVAKK